MVLSLTETHELKLEQAVPGAPTEVDLGQLITTRRLKAGFKDRGKLLVGYGIAFGPLNDVFAYYCTDIWALHVRLRRPIEVDRLLGREKRVQQKAAYLPFGMSS